MESRKRYWWTYFQGGNGDANLENRLVDTVVEGESGTDGESSINIYTLSDVRWIAGEKLLCSTGITVCTLWWPGGMGWGEGKEGREGRGEEGIIIHIIMCV